MAHSFIAYIDESGHEGGDHSEWFALSAVVTKTQNDVAVCETVDEFLSIWRKPNNHKFKFTDLKPKYKVVISRLLNQKPIKVSTIIVHKNSLQKEEWKRNHADLYFYAGKFLFERISQICNVMISENDCVGDSTVKIIFSERRNFPYERFIDYLSRLRKTPGHYGTKIDWGRINLQDIHSIKHNDSKGCMLVDVVASATTLAIEHTQHEITDDRPIRELISVHHDIDETIHDAGIKFWPRVDNLIENEPRFGWLRKYYK
jgi:uncharacterized protein DUF3800